MKNRLFLLASALMVVLLNSCNQNTPVNNYPPYDPNLFGQSVYSSAIDNFIKAKMEEGSIAGLSAAVFKNGKVEFSKGYGIQDYTPATADRLKVDVNTAFYAGELSYPLVTFAALQLSDKQLLDLDADINNYLPFRVENPSFPTTAITTRMLLSGMSSIIDNPMLDAAPYTVSDSDYDDGGMKQDTMLSRIMKDFVRAGGVNSVGSFSALEPGTYYENSRLAITVAAFIVQNISKLSINEYARAFIYNELGTVNTSYFLKEINPMNLARPHTNVPFVFTPQPHVGTAIYAGSQLRTSAAQLARLLLTIAKEGKYNQTRLLEVATVQDMLQVIDPNLNPNQATGLQYTNFNGRNLIGTSDGGLGYTNRMWFDPLTGIGVVVLANSDNCDTQVDEIMEKLFLNAE